MEVLFTRAEIDRRVSEIASEINAKYFQDETTLICICLLKGGFIFTADLVRYLKPNTVVDFMNVSSYGDSHTSSGSVKIIQDISCDIENKHVMIIDDIVDTGLTIHEIKKLLLSRNPKSVEVCCLLDKRENRKAEIEPDYYGFECPNKFVIGYGMDSANNYRHLPYVGALLI